MLILVCWLLLPGCSYLYQEEERLRLSWFGAEKGFLPIAYTTTTTTTTATAPHSVVQIQTKGRGRRRRHVRRATPRHRRCINGQSPLERYKSEDEERKKKVCRHSARRHRSAAAAATGRLWSTAGGRPGRRLWRGALSYMASVAVGLVRSY